MVEEDNPWARFGISPLIENKESPTKFYQMR